MPEFKNLVADIETLFQGKDLSERIHHLTDKLGDTFITRFLEYAEERQPRLVMSNIGWPLRKLYYHLKGVKGEPLPTEAKIKFLYGSILEELILFLAKEAGHTVEREQEVVTVDGVRGRIDGFIDGVLVDVKSCSTRSFEKFEKGTIAGDDPFGYIPQLTGYRIGVGAREAAFIAIDKVLGKLCVYHLPDRPYDLLLQIKKAREAVSLDSPPERCYEPKKVSKTDKTGNLILSSNCSYCPWKFHCWSDANEGQGLLLRHYSSGPKFFVKLIKEPRLKYNEEEEGTFQAFPMKGLD